MNKTAQRGKSVLQIKKSLIAEAQRIEAENDEANRRLSELGAELIKGRLHYTDPLQRRVAGYGSLRHSAGCNKNGQGAGQRG